MCNPNSKIFNDEERYKCEVMDSNKNCTICPNKCLYTEHFNS
jgi:hypothetical protein